MNSPRILVTGVGGDIGVNIVRCLLDGPYRDGLMGCDMSSHAFGRHYLPAFSQCPAVSDTSAYTTFLDGLISQNVKYIYPGTEVEIQYFHQKRDYFLSRGVQVLINNPLIVETFLDKLKTAQFFSSHGISHPKTELLENYKGGLRYPLILKKRFGSGSKLVLILSSDEELAFYRKKYATESLLIQEYIGEAKAEYTGGVFSDGTTVHSIVFRRSLAGDAGITLFAELVQEPAFDALARKVAQATQLKGSMNIQCRKVGQDFIPFEINPRISGTAYVRHHFGFKDSQWWLDLTNGHPIHYTPRYKKGVAVRAISEVFLDVC